MTILRLIPLSTDAGGSSVAKEDQHPRKVGADHIEGGKMPISGQWQSSCLAAGRGASKHSSTDACSCCIPALLPTRARHPLLQPFFFFQLVEEKLHFSAAVISILTQSWRTKARLTASKPNKVKPGWKHTPQQPKGHSYISDNGTDLQRAGNL